MANFSEADWPSTLLSLEDSMLKLSDGSFLNLPAAEEPRGPMPTRSSPHAPAFEGLDGLGGLGKEEEVQWGDSYGGLTDVAAVAAPSTSAVVQQTNSVPPAASFTSQDYVEQKPSADGSTLAAILAGLLQDAPKGLSLPSTTLSVQPSVPVSRRGAFSDRPRGSLLASLLTCTSEPQPQVKEEGPRCIFTWHGSVLRGTPKPNCSRCGSQLPRQVSSPKEPSVASVASVAQKRAAPGPPAVPPPPPSHLKLEPGVRPGRKEHIPLNLLDYVLEGYSKDARRLGVLKLDVIDDPRGPMPTLEAKSNSPDANSDPSEDAAQDSFSPEELIEPAGPFGSSPEVESSPAGGEGWGAEGGETSFLRLISEDTPTNAFFPTVQQQESPQPPAVSATSQSAGARLSLPDSLLAPPSSDASRLGLPARLSLQPSTLQPRGLAVSATSLTLEIRNSTSQVHESTSQLHESTSQPRDCMSELREGTPQRLSLEQPRLSLESARLEGTFDSASDVPTFFPRNSPDRITVGEWSFIFFRFLLQSSKYNPTLVKWLDTDHFVFQVVEGKTDTVTQWWAKLGTTKYTGTWGNLTRAIRDSIKKKKEGFFTEPYLEGGGEGIPKKRVLRFGPRMEELVRSGEITLARESGLLPDGDIRGVRRSLQSFIGRSLSSS